jgi:hypothetical protein
MTEAPEYQQALEALQQLAAAEPALTTPENLVDALEHRHRWHRDKAHLTRAELLRLARQVLTPKP